jgi:hypothetical protein
LPRTSDTNTSRFAAAARQDSANSRHFLMAKILRWIAGNQHDTGRADAGMQQV